MTPLVACVATARTLTVLTASLFHGKGWLERGVVAHAADGHEVVPDDEPICFRDRWVIGAVESPSSSN